MDTKLAMPACDKACWATLPLEIKQKVIEPLIEIYLSDTHASAEEKKIMDNTQYYTLLGLPVVSNSFGMDVVLSSLERAKPHVSMVCEWAERAASNQVMRVDNHTLCMEFGACDCDDIDGKLDDDDFPIAEEIHHIAKHDEVSNSTEYASWSMLCTLVQIMNVTTQILRNAQKVGYNLIHQERCR